ncbi:MAG: cyclic nucleotide-binding domain-containing protein [Pedosphaera sp.]|nr:cyclic nucleotide-binding domain-containing protein [Pedosphaera sp.]
MRKVLFIFSELNEFDIDWIIANGAKREVPRLGVLIQQGKPIENLYIILQGSFRVVLKGAREIEVARLSAGEVVGEMSLIEPRPPITSVTAEVDSLVFSISNNVLESKLKADVAFAAHFYRALAVFLSSRLRRSTTMLGYDPGTVLNEAADDHPDELGANILDNVFLAGSRFDRMLKRVVGA